MGIPSYFSHIIKNHPNILRTFAHIRTKNTQFAALYMDCNSIIYDAVRSLEGGGQQELDAFENKLIEQVIAKIKYYILTIKPSNVAYISFDGVAPMAKMDQQKERRYRSAYLASILTPNQPVDSSKFSTTAITPGTAFMRKLSERINAAFKNNEQMCSSLGVKQLVVSASDEPGEGEHKMFNYLRTTVSKSSRQENVAVYGLDADLIMLSMFHCSLCYNIHIFREAPEFSTHILPAGLKSRTNARPVEREGSFTPSDLLFIDTFKFTRALLSEMGVNTATPIQMNTRIYDYVFMCFMLGNDFMPHFLALNIRTAGIGRLMDTYNTVIAAKGLSLIHVNKNKNNKRPTEPGGMVFDSILWKNVHLFVAALAKNERAFITEEMEQRGKMAKGIAQSTAANKLNTPQEREAAIMNIPMLFRQDEEYINVAMPNWQTRYYDVAFRGTQIDVHAVCRNYCEGLEWTFRYYTAGCPNWKWKYDYSYPPLLEDLAVYLSNLDNDHSFFINTNTNEQDHGPCSPVEQLLYVLPKTHYYLLPDSVNYIAKPDDNKFDFTWLGCRYFWEAHLV